MRLEGRDLLKRGSDLEDDRRTLEAEAAVKMHKIEADLAEHVKERTDELEREKRLFDSKLAQQNDRINLDIEVRGVVAMVFSRFVDVYLCSIVVGGHPLIFF